MQDHNVNKIEEEVKGTQANSIGASSASIIAHGELANVSKNGNKNVSKNIEIHSKVIEPKSKSELLSNFYVEDKPGKRKRRRNVKHEDYIMTKMLPILPYITHAKQQVDLK